MIELPGSFSGIEDLAQAAPRARGHPAHVVGDLHQRGRQRLERTVGEEQGVVPGEGLELVGGGDERDGRSAGPARRPRGRRTRGVRSSRCRRPCRPGPARKGAGSPPRRARRPLSRSCTQPEISWPEGQRGRVHQVRPADLDDVPERLGLLRQGRRGASAPTGSDGRAGPSTAATCMAVGKTSLDDWPMLTWSLGWTLRPMPRSPPSSSLARLAITSFTFMLVWVPLPVCQTTSGKLGVVPAGDHLVGGRDDRLADRGVLELAQVEVDLGRRPLDQGQGVDQRRAASDPRRS